MSITRERGVSRTSGPSHLQVIKDGPITERKYPVLHRMSFDGDWPFQETKKGFDKNGNPDLIISSIGVSRGK